MAGREAMLARLVAYVRANGLPAEASLRWFADELGTSHRMLTYYFGSRHGVLAAVLNAIGDEDRQRLTAKGFPTRRDAAQALWTSYTMPRRRREHRAFFYVFALALQQPEPFAAFLGSLDAWVRVVTELGESEGLDPADAAVEAQLLVSAMRGLLLDRLASARPERIDAAFTQLLDRVLPVEAPARGV